MRAYHKLKSLRKTARVFGVSVSTLSRWATKGINKKYTISGNGFNIRKSEVSDFIGSYIRSHAYCSHT
jgi:DNA invertase Pin-like site-specific DNA recombinase